MNAMKSDKTPPNSFGMNRRMLLTRLVGGAVGIGGAASLFSHSAPAADEGKKVTLHKNPSCECCEGYADYLRSNGYEVKVIPTHDLTLMGEKYGSRTFPALPHLAGRRLCHRRPHPGRGGQQAARRKAADHRHQPTRHAGGQPGMGGKDRTVHGSTRSARIRANLCARLATWRPQTRRR